MSALQTKEVYRDATRSVSAVQSINYARHDEMPSLGMYVSIEPIALVVCDQDGVRVLDMEARPADVGRLRQQYRRFDALIDECIARSGR